MYRENIWELIESINKKLEPGIEGTLEGPISTLVIPKNSGLKGYAWKVLLEAGLDVNEAQEIGKNELRIRYLTLLLRRGEDIPQIVADQFRIKKPVVGLTGDDLFDEYCLTNPSNPLKIENTYDWFDSEAEFLRPALCLLFPVEKEKQKSAGRVAINPKYEMTSRQYLEKSSFMKDRFYRPFLYAGDLEDSVQRDLNACCIDTVYSGDSRKKSGLEVADILRFSDLVLISPFKDGYKIPEER